MFKLVPYRKNNLSRTEDIFDDFFHSFLNDDFFPPLSHLDTRFGGFKVDVSDGGDRYLIEADLPGMEKADIKIEYDNKYLTILARRDDAQEIKEDSIIRKERWCGQYRRSFYIDNIQAEDISATFKSGVLKIEIPKKPQISGGGNTIEIKD